MRPTARFKTSIDGTPHEVELGHGDLIGRLESAALHLADPRISEAHAMVSLRGTSLKLLTLRGRISVKGKPLAEVELRPGLVIHLARELALEVVSVTLPERVLALRIADTQERVLAGVCSIMGGAASELRSGFHADAVAHVWAHGAGLMLRRPGEADVVLGPGDRAVIDGVAVEVVEMALAGEGQYITTARGGITAPMEIVARYESVSIFRQDEPALVLTGISARIVSEVISFGVPVSWEMVARQVWPDEGSPEDLRDKWDVNLGRLRKKLESARVRTDLVRPDGRGNVELLLERGDVVRDET